MIGFERLSRPGIVISAVVHGGALALGLFFLGASSIKSMPPEVKPPDAMVVDVVPPDETPRLEGTPSDAMTSGSKSAVNSNGVSAAAQPRPPDPAAQSRQQPQQPPKPQRDARQTAQSEMQRAQAVLPLLSQSEMGQVAVAQPETTKSDQPAPPPSPPQPQLTQTPDQPDTSETIARLSLMGGRLGGGFEAPAIDSPVAAHDFRTVFLERVSSCSKMPAGIGIGDNIRVSLRVSFNPDGTLASPPQPAGAITSPEEAALMQGAINGLQKCQPYTMLPADKYREWKTLDLVFSPFSFLSR